VTSFCPPSPSETGLTVVEKQYSCASAEINNLLPRIYDAEARGLQHLTEKDLSVHSIRIDTAPLSLAQTLFKYPHLWYAMISRSTQLQYSVDLKFKSENDCCFPCPCRSLFAAGLHSLYILTELTVARLCQHAWFHPKFLRGSFCRATSQCYVSSTLSSLLILSPEPANF
jgi:hypothetical protein